MNTNFLFIDECVSTDTSIVSMTGVLIPISRYSAIESRFYEALNWIIQPDRQTINVPPELHGSHLLRLSPEKLKGLGLDIEKISDERKIQTVGKIVDIVLEYELPIVRTGYYWSEEYKKRNQWNDKEYKNFLLGTCNMNLQRTFKLSDQKLIFCLDSSDKYFQRSVQYSAQLVRVVRDRIPPESISIKNLENIIGPFFVDSEYSVFIQIADIVSYLRHVADWERCGKHMSDFKNQLLAVSKRLHPPVLLEKIVAMEHPK